MATVELTTENFDQTVSGDGIVLVDLWADWCRPCKAFAPTYDAASEQHPDVTFGKVDTEANHQLAGELDIQAVPTLMAFRDGILLYREAGALNGAQLEQLIGQVKSLDMAEVRAKVEELTAEQDSAQA